MITPAARPSSTNPFTAMPASVVLLLRREAILILVYVVMGEHMVIDSIYKQFF
jgi:hypothetical protein